MSSEDTSNIGGPAELIPSSQSFDITRRHGISVNIASPHHRWDIRLPLRAGDKRDKHYILSCDVRPPDQTCELDVIKYKEAHDD
jgi:hypothetical protein